MNARRFLSVTTLSVAALLVLGACGGGGDSSGEASAKGSTRTVESTFTGKKVEIPTEPKRVVALWRTGAELVDIGVKPVGQLQDEITESELGADTYAKYKDVPSVGTFEGLDVEKIIALKPDLILGMDNSALEIDYSEIEDVAPTVILKIAEPTDVWDNYTTIADLAGKSTDFDTKEAALDKELAAIKSKHGDALSKLSVTALSGLENAIWVDTSKSLTYRRLHAAGFGYNKTYTDDPERYVVELSAENTADLADQDAIFYAVDVTGKADAATQKIIDSSSFKRLPAAKTGHVFPVTSGTIYTFAAGKLQAADIAKAADTLAAEG